jgi:hypothetical protein
LQATANVCAACRGNNFVKPSHIPALLAACALTLSGQSAFDGPASGYVFDGAARAVRPVVGVPGAAVLGTASGPAWDFLSVAPNGKRALALAGGSLHLIPDLSKPADFAEIGPLQAQVARIAWSADSTAAAMWSPRARELRRITGLDGTPALHDPVDLTSLGGVLAGWSLSPDGRSLALSGPGLGSTYVYLSAGDAAPVALAPVANAGSIAFSPEGDSFFISSASRQILRLDSRSGAVIGVLDASRFNPVRLAAPNARAVRGAPGLANRPVVIEDLAVSAAGTRLYAIAGKTLCGYDLSGDSTPSCQDLEISPSSFERMPGGALLLNYSRTVTMPLWLVDAGTGQTYFVPSAIRAGDASNQHASN